jgi:hypothetical protein
VVYSGDSNFTSISKTRLQVVRKASTTTVVLSYPNPATHSELITFVAFVYVPGPGAGTPTGTVTFKEGLTILGTADLSGGVAIFTTSSLSIKSHRIKAVYSGDSNFKTSTSSILIQVVT